MPKTTAICAIISAVCAVAGIPPTWYCAYAAYLAARNSAGAATQNGAAANIVANPHFDIAFFFMIGAYAVLFIALIVGVVAWLLSRRKSAQRLKIISAFYEFDSNHSEDVTGRIANIPRDGLVITVNNNTMGCDPMPNVPPGKRLRVRYKYGNDVVQESELSEGSIMVLPKQVDHGSNTSSISDLVSDSDPLIYPEFTDARHIAIGDKRENQAYFILVNRGGSEARNIILDPIEIDGKIVQFYRHRLAAPLLPKREVCFYPDVVTKDNGSVTDREKDLFHLFYLDYHRLGDSTIYEATTAVTATYQDSARNLFEVTCELVFDPSAHADVRIGHRGPSPVIFTRNHRFRKIAATTAPTHEG